DSTLITARTSCAGTPCLAATASMISPYGTASGVEGRGAATVTSGSGYGTSSGAKRTMVLGSQTISPPERSDSTSESPSRRWPLIDIALPLAKDASLARAGAAAQRTIIDTNGKARLLV